VSIEARLENFALRDWVDFAAAGRHDGADEFNHFLELLAIKKS
jgi:hypothetical protein